MCCGERERKIRISQELGAIRPLLPETVYTESLPGFQLLRMKMDRTLDERDCGAVLKGSFSLSRPRPNETG